MDLIGNRCGKAGDRLERKGAVAFIVKINLLFFKKTFLYENDFTSEGQFSLRGEFARKHRRFFPLRPEWFFALL